MTWILADVPDNDLALSAAIGLPGYSHASRPHAGNLPSGAPVRTVYYRGPHVTVARITRALVRMHTGVERVTEEEEPI